MTGATAAVAESHLRMVVVAVGERARPLEEQVEGEEGVGEVEGPPGERTWVGLKGVLTLVAIYSGVRTASVLLHLYTVT